MSEKEQKHHFSHVCTCLSLSQNYVFALLLLTAELFKEANNAVSNFVQDLKDQNLWDSTAIVMGSDFGRSLNPNSNGGSDHACKFQQCYLCLLLFIYKMRFSSKFNIHVLFSGGGNYFLLGGKVKGGQILGTYPFPLTPDHPKWIGRGRFIPETPWDAVWNGVGNWMGLQSDEDLDFALPNRKSFSKCDDLFYDSDLFIDGACTCNECVEVTYSPTMSPTTKQVSCSSLPNIISLSSTGEALTPFFSSIHSSQQTNQHQNQRFSLPQIQHCLLQMVNMLTPSSRKILLSLMLDAIIPITVSISGRSIQQRKSSTVTQTIPSLLVSLFSRSMGK